jgi:hypothetical protein
VNLAEWAEDYRQPHCVVPRAGEFLFRVGTPPHSSEAAS